MPDRPVFRVVSLLCVLGLAGLVSGCAGGAAAGRFAVIDGKEVPVPRIPMGEPGTVRRVLEISKRDSRVMEHLGVLSGTYGPRLTGSSSAEEAGRWAMARFEDWGLSGARMEAWGEMPFRFDRGPSVGEVVRPSRERGGRGDEGSAEGTEQSEPAWEVERTLEFSTLSWTRGTDGSVVGAVVRLPDSLEGFDPEAFRGAWVLIPAQYGDRRGVRQTGFSMRQREGLRHRIRTGAYDPSTEPIPETWAGTIRHDDTTYEAVFLPERDRRGRISGGRMSIPGTAEGEITDVIHEDDSLRFVWNNPIETASVEMTIDGKTMSGLGAERHEIRLEERSGVDERAANREEDRVLAAVLAAEPAGFLSPSIDERVWTTRSDFWKDDPSGLPADLEVSIRRSDYDWMNSRLADGAEVHARFDLPHRIGAGPVPVYNTIAEIPGRVRPDEVVIVSAHLDSWDGPGSQGTLDNGTGSAVVLEAARLLAEAGARPDRTIRFVLWTGEEQGLLGSEGYVESLSEDERSRISAVFVDDGGTNYEGGLPAADHMVEYLAAATAAVNGVFYSETDGEYLNVNIRPTGEKIQTHGGSDHASFNRVGIPGFFWDEIGRSDYGYGWHTQNDRLDLAIEEYLVQSAACMAITAYNLASAPALLPREPAESVAGAAGSGR
jgi:hypothetical protein